MHSSLLGLLAFLSLSGGFFDETPEHTHKSHSAHYAVGRLNPMADAPKLSAWPVKLLSIGHTIASYQLYGSSEAYFHHGLDIRADDGSPVTASRGGKVVNIENYVPGNPQYWEVAILDTDGFLWQYHHIDRDSIPNEVMQAFQTGREIATGTKIGTVVYWPVVSFGERFNHIHLNILGKDKQYLNPFNFLEPLNDTSAPEIGEIGLLKNGAKFEGTKVSGSYSLYAEVKDLILSNVFTVPPKSIDVSVDGGKPFTVWDFSQLPGGADENKFVTNFYVPSLACGNYSCRKPVIDLGFRRTAMQVFPTESGEHKVSITIKDDYGNSAVKDFTYLTE